MVKGTSSQMAHISKMAIFFLDFVRKPFKFSLIVTIRVYFRLLITSACILPYKTFFFFEVPSP